MTAHKIIVAPLIVLWVDSGYDPESWVAAFLITAFYTFLSYWRVYLIRRWNNARAKHEYEPADWVAEFLIWNEREQ